MREDTSHTSSYPLQKMRQPLPVTGTKPSQETDMSNTGTTYTSVSQLPFTHHHECCHLRIDAKTLFFFCAEACSGLFSTFLFLLTHAPLAAPVVAGNLFCLQHRHLCSLPGLPHRRIIRRRLFDQNRERMFKIIIFSGRSRHFRATSVWSHEKETEKSSEKKVDAPDMRPSSLRSFFTTTSLFIRKMLVVG